MVKRLLVGLVLGVVIGGVVAAALVQGLGMAHFSNAVFAYLAAAVTGALAGLVAGKPIWASDGRIESGLKAFFGVLLSLGAMFALRQWVTVHLDLSALKAGSDALGNLPAVSLPLIAAVLSAFYELDNTPSAEGDDEGKEDAKGKGASKDASNKKMRVEADEVADEEEEEEPASAKKKRN